MKSKSRIARLFACLLAGCLLLLCSLSVSAEENRAPLSPALDLLAQTTDLSLWHLSGEELRFSEDCFLRGLNLSKLSTVRLTQLPSAAQGTLCLGKNALSAGALLSAEELSNLTFEPASKAIQNASFSFEVNECGVQYLCRLYTLERANASPSVGAVPTLSTKLSTHKNIPLTGRFYADDPEGDEMTFEIAVPPRYGSIRVFGDSYTYLPFPNYSGADSFSYVARDRYGNYSAACKVSFSVELGGEGIAFVDLADPATQNAVLTLSDAGLLGGTRVGNKTYFYPERAMTRAEFLVLAMSASGIDDLPDCADTGFFDDAEIPNAMKPYVAAAYRLGYIGGHLKGGEVCFLPEGQMTKGEAALLLQKILLLDEPQSVFAVSGRVGNETVRAVSSLIEIGLIDIDGVAYPAGEVLTRGEAAKLLAGVFSLCR